MTNKKTEHTTEDGTTFKVGDTIVEVDRVGNPFSETLGTVEGFTKTLMKVTQTNGEKRSYRLNVNYDATNIQDLRVYTDKHRDILRAGRKERMVYRTAHDEINRLLYGAYISMHNNSGVGRTTAPDPQKAYNLLKEAQSKFDEAITRIEVEVGEVLDY